MGIYSSKLDGGWERTSLKRLHWNKSLKEANEQNGYIWENSTKQEGMWSENSLRSTFEAESEDSMKWSWVDKCMVIGDGIREKTGDRIPWSRVEAIRTFRNETRSPWRIWAGSDMIWLSFLRNQDGWHAQNNLQWRKILKKKNQRD